MRPDDLPTLLRHQFANGSVWVSRDSVHPHDGVLEAMRSEGELRGAFATELGVLLLSDDLRLRTGAVALMREVATDIGVDTLAALALRHEAKFRGIKPAWRIEQDDLEHVLAGAVASRAAPGDAAAVAWLQGLAGERAWGSYLLADLARLDGDWLIAHARALVPHEYLGVLRALDPSRQERLIDALSPYPPEKPTFFTAAFWKALPAADVERLRSRMWPPAPPLPGAPELRAALEAARSDAETFLAEALAPVSLRTAFAEPLAGVLERSLAAEARELARAYRELFAALVEGTMETVALAAAGTAVERCLASQVLPGVPACSARFVVEGETAALGAWLYVDGAWRVVPAAPAVLQGPSGAVFLAPPTGAGLIDTVEALLAAAARGDVEALRHGLLGARLPDPLQWMTIGFGANRGAAMATRYRESLDGPPDLLLRCVLAVAELRGVGADLEVRCRVVGQPAVAELGVRFLPLRPAASGAMGHVEVGPFALHNWIHVDGAWRWAGLLAAWCPLPGTPQGLADAAELWRLLHGSEASVQAALHREALAIPNAPAWFARVFGAERGAHGARSYAEQLSQGALGEVWMAIVTRRLTDVQGHLDAVSDDATGGQRQLLAAMRVPVPLFTMTFDEGYTLLSFVHVDGAWRWLGRQRGLLESAPDAPSNPDVDDASSPAALLAHLQDVSLKLRQHAGKQGCAAVVRGDAPPPPALLAWAEELLLPDPAAWFAFTPSLGAAYAASNDATGLARALAGLALVEQLPAAVEAVGEASPLSLRVLGPLCSAPLFEVLHVGPGGPHRMGAFAFVGGKWRWVGPGAGVQGSPAWRDAVAYERRFPPTAQGLHDLLMTLVALPAQEVLQIDDLFGRLLPEDPPVAWFLGFGAPADDWRAELLGLRASVAQTISARLADDVDDVVIEVQRLDLPVEAFVVAWSSLRADERLVFGPFRHADGAWRLLSGAVGR